MGDVYETDIFKVKTNRLEETFESKLLRMCNVFKFHENASRNDEVMVILLSLLRRCYTR